MLAPKMDLSRCVDLCQGALHGRTPSTSASSLRFAKVYHSALYRAAFTVLCLSWLALPFVEPPFRSPASAFPLPLVRGFDAAFLALSIADSLLLQRAAYGGAAWLARGWVRAKLAALFALVVNLAVVVGFDAGGNGGLRRAYYVARVLRPLLLVERFRNLRKLCDTGWRTLPSALSVGALFLAQLLFFSVLGVVLFNGVDGVNCARARGAPVPPLGCSAFVPRDSDAPSSCKLFFSTLGEASIHLFALSTAANVPMVFMPVVGCSLAAAWFFVAFTGAALLCFGMLALAVAAAGAGEGGGEEAVARQGRALAGANAAFAELLAAAGAPAGTPRAPPAAVLSLLSALRPDLPARTLPLLAAAAARCGEGGAGEGLSRAQFAALVLVFAPLRIGEKAVQPALPLQLPAPASAPALGEAPSGRISWLCRCCVGRAEAHKQGPPPLDSFAAELQDAEFFDGDGEGWAPQLGGGGGEAPPASAVVKNPLAGVVAAADAAAPATGEAAAELAVAVGTADSVTSWGPAAPAPGGASRRAAPLCARTRDAFVATLSSVPLASPPLDGSAGPLRTRAALLINAPLATLLFDGAIVVNTVVELYRLSTEVEGAPRTAAVDALVNAQRAMLAVFTLEFSLKLAVFGPLSYLRAGWGHKLDALILGASLGAGFAEAAGRFDATLTLLIQLLRALRLGRYAQKLRRGIARRTGVTLLAGFGPTVSAAVDTLPLLGRWAVLLAAALYAFAVAGGEAFSGALGGAASLASAWGASATPRLAFSSFPRAALAVYALLLNNTWPVLMEGAVAGTGTVWARAYFVLFIVATRGFLLPLIAGSAAACYGSLWRARVDAESCGRRPVGVVDWRAAVGASGGVWSGLALSRNRQWDDALAETWRARVVAAFPEMRAWEGGAAAAAPAVRTVAWLR
jgi:hypothetical protein